MGKFILIIMLILLPISLFGQVEHLELSLSGGTGYTFIRNSIPDSKSSEKSGYIFNFQINIALSHILGIGIGAGYSKYSSDVSLDKFYNATPAVDSEGDDYEYRLYGSNLNENQSINIVEFPFLIILQNRNHKKFKVYLEAGCKAMVPVQFHFAGSTGEIETRGYYPQFNVELSNMPNHGFDVYSIKGVSGNLPTKVTYAAVIELGTKFSLGKMYLTFALFGSYGLSSLSNSKELFTVDHTYQSLSSVSSKTELSSIGAKIGISFPF